MINARLNEIKKIFDRIESYAPEQNIGMRSLKNIGVWLSVYALTEDKDQIRVIQELTEKARITDANEIAKIKAVADELIQPEILRQIIGDYQKANGDFSLTVNNASIKKRLENKIIERKLDFMLENVIVDASAAASLTFLMKNIIKFNWTNKRGSAPGVYKQTKQLFANEETDFLVASNEKNALHYGMIEQSGRLFHVVQLATLQNRERTNAYILEPVNPEDAVHLQKDYLEIINHVTKHGFDDLQTFHRLQSLKALNTIKVQGQLQEINKFRFKVSFPQIAAPLQTTEERLGIYAQFDGKEIAHTIADNIKYKGVRELIYDEKGGEIKNREEFGMMTTSFERGPNIFIDYDVENPFMMVYEGVNGADYYPYFIANPKQNLTMHFRADDAYPSQALEAESVADASKKQVSHRALHSLFTTSAMNDEANAKVENNPVIDSSRVQRR